MIMNSSRRQPVRAGARAHTLGLGVVMGAVLAALSFAAGLAGGASTAAASEDFLASMGRMDWTSTPDAYGPSGRRAALAPAVDDSGDDEDAKPARKKRRVASLGPAAYSSDEEDQPKKPKRSVAAGSGGGINWSASASCLNGTLRSVLSDIAANYGSLRVNSTCRSHSHNARVGGAPKSYHLSGDAVDFRVFGNAGAVYSALKSNGSVGGLKHYGGGLFHIDTGPRRSW
jgi:hypothetical protein